MPAYDDARFAPPAPVALITIRHPDRLDVAVEVPALIDSGADVTLLPASAIASIGIQATGERFRLVGFDGTPSEAEAIRADLAFAGRRFRGQYLLTDAEVGVLGRDVLNHLRILLDGPGREWKTG